MGGVAPTTLSNAGLPTFIKSPSGNPGSPNAEITTPGQERVTADPPQLGLGRCGDFQAQTSQDS